jgi:hypothetical protein
VVLLDIRRLVLDGLGTLGDRRGILVPPITRQALIHLLRSEKARK